MKTRLLMISLAVVSASALADAPLGPPTMKFTSIPVVEKVGAGEHKIFPYRIEDKLVVIVQDPIVCGQKPLNPKFELKGNRLTLLYELTKAPAGVSASACTAHSTFEISNVPDRELEVAFAGGPEPFTVATMTRCPGAKPNVDIWDCLVPHK
jgi:hypothetical protein